MDNYDEELEEIKKEIIKQMTKIGRKKPSTFSVNCTKNKEWARNAHKTLESAMEELIKNGEGFNLRAGFKAPYIGTGFPFWGAISSTADYSARVPIELVNKYILCLAKKSLLTLDLCESV